MLKSLALTIALAAAGPLCALDLDAPFDSIDGGTIVLADWSGRPVLVVNTASQCAFTRQYRGLQDLHDRYREDGLVVLAVPSDDFNQELETEAEIRDFCELTYGIDMPMTVITTVTGEAAHPFYASLREEAGIVPDWNFNKVLIGPDGSVAGHWGSSVRPEARAITALIEDMLSPDS